MFVTTSPPTNSICTDVGPPHVHHNLVQEKISNSTSRRHYASPQRDIALDVRNANNSMTGVLVCDGKNEIRESERA